MKIKQEKQLTLPQLIEWAMKNKIKERMFLTESAYCVGFDKHGFIYFNSTNTMPLDQLFTVEVEEEITKDTKLPSALVYDGKYFKAYYGLSINDIENKFADYVYGIETIHLINGDTHTLVYKNGKLVE